MSSKSLQLGLPLNPDEILLKTTWMEYDAHALTVDEVASFTCKPLPLQPPALKKIKSKE